MKILIIEDEPLVAKDLEKLIHRLVDNPTIVGVIASVSGAKKWFAENAPPDLILSDIQLSDGISFEIFESLQLQCPIIFTTAYDEYAIRAFKLNSIDYLLKPIDSKELRAALNKYKSLTSEHILSEQLKHLVNHWNGSPAIKYKERFLALHRNSLVPVAEAEIAFFHKEELIYLQTVKGDKHISEHQTLDEVESLVNPAKFFRVNRQYLLHLQAVDKIRTTHKGLTVQLKQPYAQELDISREKAVAFKKWLES